METSAVSNSPAPSANDSQPSFQLPGIKQDFLKILVHQMKNQDPFAAADSGAFLEQMAQFSSLEQIQNLNTNIAALVTLQSQNAAIQDLSAGSALIGQTILFDDENGIEQTGVVEAVSVSNQGATLRVGDKQVPLLAVKEVQGKLESSTEEGTEGSGS